MNVQGKNVKKKSIFTKGLKIFAVLLLIFLCIIIVNIITLLPQKLEVSNIDPGTIQDGVYTGSADNGLVRATVSVEVEDGVIDNIVILEHDNLLGKPAEKIVDDIIEQQALEVDAITSATYSSYTIRKAVENAFREGELE